MSLCKSTSKDTIFYNSIDWFCLHDLEEVDDAVEQFYYLLHQEVDQFVPKQIIKTSKYPRWYDITVKFRHSGLTEEYPTHIEFKFRIDTSYVQFISNT